MKVNDKVICIDDSEFPHPSVCERLIKDKIYIITDVAYTDIDIKVNRSQHYWGKYRFRKIEGFTNKLTRALADYFTEKDGRPEIERIKIFTTKANF